MPIVADTIELQTHRPATTLRLSNVEKFEDGSGYRCDLSVRSGAFAYDGPFFFHDAFVVNSMTAIKKMMAGKPGEAVLKGQYEDDAIRFQMNQLGHVTVSGLLLENGGHTQSLKFEFMTDQTVFGPLLRDLAALHQSSLGRTHA
jgi:hypothetical protein